MAKVPPPVLPRDIDPSRVGNVEVPPGAFQRAQGGPLQARDFNRAGRSWREVYPYLSPRRVNDAKFLSRLRWLRGRAKFFWADHPNLQGSGIPVLGNGRENLIRDAAMDTDGDSDGVVDSFDSATSGTGWSFSLNGGAGAQTISADGTGSNGDEAEVRQVVLRVFPGDEVTASADARLQTPSDLEGAVRVEWLDDGDSEVGTAQETTFTATSFARRSVTGTAPDDAAYARVVLLARLTAGSGSGDAEFRDARLLRASSDPSSWSNPHVSGGSQTGDTLDTAGWPADTRVLEAGDVFRVGGSAETKSAAETDEVVRSFEVLAPVDSDGSGAATVPIDPPVFSGLTVPDGAALRFEGMRMRVGMPEASLPKMSSQVDKYAGISATLVETL